jgi:hypothetical protein
MSIILILIALGAGVFIGSRFESAHDAHQRFSSYRTRTNKSLSEWLKGATVTTISVAVLVLLLGLFVFH